MNIDTDYDDFDNGLGDLGFSLRKLRKRINKAIAKSPLIKKMPKPLQKVVKKAGIPGLLTPKMTRDLMAGKGPTIPFQKKIASLVISAPGTKMLFKKLPGPARKIALRYGIPGLMTPAMVRRGMMKYDKKYRAKFLAKRRSRMSARVRRRKGGPFIALPPPRYVGRPVAPPVYREPQSEERPPFVALPVEQPTRTYYDDAQPVDDPFYYEDAQATPQETDEKNYPPGRAGFEMWLQDWNPDLFSMISRQEPELLDYEGQDYYMSGLADYHGGLGQSDSEQSGGWASKLLDFAKTAGLMWRENKIMETQLKRAKQGLEPLALDQISPIVNVGMAPKSRNMLMIGAGLLAATVLLPKLLKK